MINPLTRSGFRRDHRWTPDHLSEFVDGDLALRSRTRLQRHVERCPDCNRALVGLQRVLDGLHRMPRPETPDRPGASRAPPRYAEGPVPD